MKTKRALWQLWWASDVGRKKEVEETVDQLEEVDEHYNDYINEEAKNLQTIN